MTIENLEKIWQEFGISEQTTNLIINKIRSISQRADSPMFRIIFTIEVLMWICSDPYVAQSIERDITPRKIDEFITAFFKRGQDEVKQRMDALQSLITSMGRRDSYLSDKKELTSVEEFEMGDTYNGLGSDMHKLMSAINVLTYRLRDEGKDYKAIRMPEATIDLNDIDKLPLRIKKGTI